MNLTPDLLQLQEINDSHHRIAGGKAVNLARLQAQGFDVSPGSCVTTPVYIRYVNETGIASRIAIELNRKFQQDMRWEELWDAALRIRHMFMTTPFPPDMEVMLQNALSHFQSIPVVIRSSAAEEDSARHSFAGMHESYVNILGMEEILEHIRLVWASLWSDRALLYRQELNLTPDESGIAVLVQQWIDSHISGVAFEQDPTSPDRAIIEAVPGQNQALVDGSIEPHRWFLDNRDGRILSSVPDDSRLLSPNQLSRIYAVTQHCSRLFGSPQDVEWTFFQDTLYILQSRPITTLETEHPGETPWEAPDKRPWYLSLTKSFHHLKKLKVHIEEQLLPQMDRQAEELAAENLEALDNNSLANELHRRRQIYGQWAETYHSQLIPFAHGARLFGQVYNDAMKPEDPFAFTRLLVATNMKSLARNRRLQQLAKDYLADPSQGLLDKFLQEFGDLTYDNARLGDQTDNWKRWLNRLAVSQAPEEQLDISAINRLTQDFIDRFPPEKRSFAEELIDIARASYMLRDNDNIHLAKIESRLIDAQNLARRRIASYFAHQLDTDQLIQCLRDPHYIPTITTRRLIIDEPLDKHMIPNLTHPQFETQTDEFVLNARQIRGQPAGTGLAEGPARIVSDTESLFSFKQGEILVCDAIDPNMTFIVPLAAAIVERRGGMLVHGAIIAREYGLPCVTGVPNALDFIQTGARLTVDGYLGIVTIHDKDS